MTLENLILLGVMILQVIIPFIPAEVIVIASANKGLLQVTFFAGTGLFIGSILVYYLGVYFKQKISLFKKKKLVRIINGIKKYETMLLWMRILPYNPSDLISYASGIMQVNKKKYFLITFFTSYTRCLLLASLGKVIIDAKTFFVIMGLLLFSGLLAQSIITYINT